MYRSNILLRHKYSIIGESTTNTVHRTSPKMAGTLTRYIMNTKPPQKLTAKPQHNVLHVLCITRHLVLHFILFGNSYRLLLVYIQTITQTKCIYMQDFNSF